MYKVEDSCSAKSSRKYTCREDEAPKFVYKTR